MITPTAETEAACVVTLDQAIEITPSSRSRKLLPFDLILFRRTGLRQSAFSLADQAVASITNFVTGVIIARACSKQEFGLYMLGFSLILLVTDLQTSLISTPYMVYAPRLRGVAHALYTGSTLIHQLAFSFFTMLFFVGAGLVADYGFGQQNVGFMMWILSVVIAPIMLREFGRRVCFTRLRLKAVLYFDACIGIAQISCLLVLAHFHMLSASRAYWVIGFSCGVAAFWWLRTEKESYDSRIDESLRDLKKNWIFGKWVFASGLVWAVSMNLYPWLLAAFHGTASAGAWGACLGVVSVVNPALLGIQNIIGPKIAHEYAAGGADAVRSLVLKMTAIIVLPMSTISLVMILWGEALTIRLYGGQYAGNGSVVAILALNLLVTAIAFSYSRALFAIERADLDFLHNLVALFIMVTLGLWLVRAFGLFGAACGLLAANSATSAVRVGAFLSLSTRNSATREVE